MRFLTSPAEIDLHRDLIVRLLTPVVTDAARGEFTMDDILESAKAGTMHIGICEQPEMCGAFEFRHYAQFMAVNIVALGGKGFDQFAGYTLHKFRQWAALAGATRIEALCSPAMARMLGRWGFTKDYEQVSIPVGEPC